MTLTDQFRSDLGNKVLAQLCLRLPLGCHQSECEPGNHILLWSGTNRSDQIQEAVGKDIDLQHLLQQGR